jgi:5-methyltetrahydropteroyltriglutamate--homocysteine methyltransferase
VLKLQIDTPPIAFGGAVSNATDVVEHPELVADRILTFANIVGRENVIAGTDCGLGGRVHPQIARGQSSARYPKAPRLRARSGGRLDA